MAEKAEVEGVKARRALQKANQGGAKVRVGGYPEIVYAGLSNSM